MDLFVRAAHFDSSPTSRAALEYYKALRETYKFGTKSPWASLPVGNYDDVLLSDIPRSLWDQIPLGYQRGLWDRLRESDTNSNHFVTER